MGDAKMRCNECQQLVAKYTTSMKSHWVKKHKDKNQPTKKIRAEVNSELSEPKDKCKRIQSALAAALSIPALPINSFLHPLMRKLFHSLNSNYELPRSFATLKNILLDQYVKTQSKMKADLSTMRQRFSITCDVWTDRGLKNAYLGVTLHYSDQQAFLQRVFLGLKQLEGSHTSFVIRRETEKLLTEYGLNLSSAFKVVTDAGSNMVKGFSDVRAVDVEGECSEQDENDEQEEYAGADQDYETMDLLLVSAFPLRMNCFAHALQLVIMECFKDCLSKVPGYATMIQMIGKFRKALNIALKRQYCIVCGVDPLKLWANMLKTDAKNIAILALEVLSIPATSAPIERIFSQAGLASSKHRNRTSFDLLNSHSRADAWEMSSQIGNEHQMLWILASVFFFQLNLALFSCFRGKKNKRSTAPATSVCENICDSTGRSKKQKSKEKPRKRSSGYTFQIVSKKPLHPVKQERKTLTDDNQYENLFMLQQADQANEGKAPIEKQAAANMGFKNSVEPKLSLDNSNERSKDTGKNIVDQKNIIAQPADVVKTIVPVPPIVCIRSDEVTPLQPVAKILQFQDVLARRSLATFLRIQPNENQNSIDEGDQEEDIGLLAEEDDTQPDWTVKSSKKQHKGQEVKHK
uniref:HAT C-terminal dimerisation domain-containing protein n=1 Tax=Ditylenchus dipsaci TaxID=166011 RepID=A0A915E6M4_9BILA